MEPHTLAHWASPALLLAILCALVWMIRCANKAEDNKYRVLDLFVNSAGKADLDRHVIALLAVLSVWTVVVRTIGLYKGEDPTALLSIVLGAFLVKQGAQKLWGRTERSADDPDKDKP